MRYLRGGKQGESWTTAAASPPLLLHFIPAVSGRAIAVAGDGLVSLVRVSTPEEANKFTVFQVCCLPPPEFCLLKFLEFLFIKTKSIQEF